MGNYVITPLKLMQNAATKCKGYGSEHSDREGEDSVYNR